MKLVSCQSRGNLFARVKKTKHFYYVFIDVFAHWKGRFLSWAEGKRFEDMLDALDFVEKQLDSYGGKQ